MRPSGVSDKLSKIADKLGLSRVDWHIFLCAESEKQKCCHRREGELAWDYLKERVKQLELDEGGVHIYRTRANCLRVCKGGPIAVIYPGGTWYHSAHPPALERIIHEHLIGGKPVQEFLLADNSNRTDMVEIDATLK